MFVIYYITGSSDIVENSTEINIGPESEMKEDIDPSISNSNPAQQDEETEKMKMFYIQIMIFVSQKMTF